MVIDVFRKNQGIPKPIQAITRETGVAPQSTPKIKQVLEDNVDLSNIDKVLANAHLSEKESRDRDDHQRQKPGNETCIPHPPGFARLAVRQEKFGQEDPNIVR